MLFSKEFSESIVANNRKKMVGGIGHSILGSMFQKSQERASVEKIRRLYADLLHHIDVSNNLLGRRGVDEIDEKLRSSSFRYMFSRSLLPKVQNSTNVDEDDPSISSTSSSTSLSKNIELKDLAAAFRILAATRSADKEGQNLGAAAIRDDASVSALSTARNIERRVVMSLSLIGQLVADGDRSYVKTSLRDDSVFEYFCEKSMLSLFVDIAREIPSHHDGAIADPSSCFHGVVWSPLVKAQVFQTTSLLIKSAKNESVLYYLLSNGCVNELLCSVNPIQRWTDPALDKMMPAYVDLLDNITLRLETDSDMFPFLIAESTDSQTPSTLPLFNAALDIATSAYASSDSNIYGICINVVISIIQMPTPTIQSWIDKADLEQQRIAFHLCERLNYRQSKIASLSTGPIVDSVRCNAIAGQLSTYQVQIGMINEIFWSGIRGLNVRLCESLLQQVVSTLFQHLLPMKRSRFLDVGTQDVDCIPAPEAMAQLATICLTFLFKHIGHAPFQRMLVVALLHPKTTSAWESIPHSKHQSTHLGGSASPKSSTAAAKYILMRSLNELVQDTAGESLTTDNVFKAELVKCIGGKYGAWRVASSAVLLESILKCEAIDTQTLSAVDTLFNVGPSPNDSTPIEKAITTYLHRNHQFQSQVSKIALETLASVSVQMLVRSILCDIEARKSSKASMVVLKKSAIWKGLRRARQYFCAQVLACQSKTGITDMFLDIIESTIIDRYKMHRNSARMPVYTSQISRREYSGVSGMSELLVRKFRGVGTNDVEITRFHAEMALHFRGICRALQLICHRVASHKGHRLVDKHGKILLVTDEADFLCRKVGGLVNKPDIGTDLDLRGRMTFRFHSPAKDIEHPAASAFHPAPDPARRGRSFSEELGVFRPKNALLLVLDPTDIYIVQPTTEQIESNRGTIILAISLRTIIAAAADGENLHVAVKHDDVKNLIRNGNMALRFESAGACLIVQQYLDRSRHALRKEMTKEALALFGEFATEEREDGEEKKDQQDDERRHDEAIC